MEIRPEINCGPRIRGSWETRSVRLCGLSCRFYVVPINCIATLGNIVRRISPEAIVGLRSFHGSVYMVLARWLILGQPKGHELPEIHAF